MPLKFQSKNSSIDNIAKTLHSSMADLAQLQKQVTLNATTAPTPSWDIGDYTGNYHRRRIKKSHAIPGSQLAREQKREFEALERWRRPARLVEAQKARSKHALEQAEKIRSNLEAIRSTYGWQSNAAGVQTLVGEIDVATIKFSERREPDIEIAKKKMYSDVQKRLLNIIHTSDYHGAHAFFLDPKIETPNCNFSVGQHSTPLILAVRKGDVKMTRILIKQGHADSNYPNSMGIPALFYVFEEWREQILYKIPAKDSLITMLSRAVELIEILGIAGANVNAVGLGGETPVHVAAGLGQARHLFLLCKFGFDPTLRNNVGQLALDVARAQDRTECVIILTEVRLFT